MTENSNTPLYFPINQREAVAQKKANTLLAVDVYTQIHSFVKNAIPSEENEDDDLNANRQHSAILIDGARGTGKSAVLVNLGLYLADIDKTTSNQVHIFKPIDPTLLEDHDNLFLNVIVGAILTDKTVVAAQTSRPEDRACLHKQLQRLGTALEGLQKQREQQGLDKLRSFIGNHQLMQEVHNFFGVVRKLLGKKLLIITIDDVDTSLNQAFENLEVVRRYLTSPHVLPIISGDQRLYHEVTWREFHGKLIKPSSYAKPQAYEKALELANEYQRKILPLQYRLKMPQVSDYLQNNNILLAHTEGSSMSLPLPLFHAWVAALLNGPVNGLENSYLPVPLGTIRSLAQLINRVKELIPPLATSIAAAKLDDEMSIKRALLMPTSVSNALRAFAANYTVREKVNNSAYSAFKKALPAPPEPATLSENKFLAPSREWSRKLHEHFQFDPMGGTAYLVLQAQADWANQPIAGRSRSIFDTPLFQPLKHSDDALAIFAANVDLNEWQLQLKGRAPEGWLARLPTNAILPYPVPELGCAITGGKKYRFAEGENYLENNLLVDLLLNKNFYSTNKKAKLICVGRIVELIITSLLRDINQRDIELLLQRPPFYSFSHIAATKTHFISDNDGTAIDAWQEDTDAELAERDAAIASLVTEIAEWRTTFKIGNLNVSPWLVYNVFNKVMNQAWLFNEPTMFANTKESQIVRTIARVARKTFYSVWSAFGSFEKGAFYELQPVISTVNIGDGEIFENSDLYRQNIAPFYSKNTQERRFFGEQIRAITFLLGEHPLRRWVEQTPKPDIEPAKPIPVPERSGPTSTQPTIADEINRAKEELGKELGVQLKSRVEATTLAKAMRKSKFSVADATALHARLRKEFPHAGRLMNTFLRAIDKLADTTTPPTKSAP